MNVNLTVFVQAVHFFLAWFMLHYFYFKPALKLLDKQQREADALTDAKRKLEHLVASRQHEQQQHWYALACFSKKHTPTIVSDDLVCVTMQDEGVKQDPQAYDQLVTQIKQALLAGVKCVE